MIRFIKLILMCAGILYFFLQPAFAENQVVTDVLVIYASTGPQNVDPSLNKIISELKSVFKYTSYSVLKDQRLKLGFNEKGKIDLPENRTLVIMPSNMNGKRIPYQINIQKDGQPIFQTQVLLKNNGSITIGGPQFNNGILLFNISGSVQ